MELHFGPSTFENHQAALFKLRQTSSVMDYQQQFEALSNQVMGLTPELFLNCFISGLRQDIQREIVVHHPYTLPQAMGLAKLLEAKILDSKPPFQRTQHPASTTTGPNSLPIKYLTSAERDDRRAKNLCFHCDERFVPGHRCVTKKFLLMIADDHPPPTFEPQPLDTGPLDASNSIPSSEPPSEPTFDSAQFQLSQAALSGPPSPRTL